MEYTKDFIKEKLATDERWAIRGLLAVYAKQTNYEQTVSETVDANGVGFNGRDAEILSSIAQFYQRRGFVSTKQMAIVRRKMPKYAGQLLKIAKGVI